MTLPEDTYLPEAERIYPNQQDYFAPTEYNAVNDLSNGVNDSPPYRDNGQPPVVTKTFRVEVLAGIGAFSLGLLRGMEIGFNARSVLIDNACGQYWWAPALNCTVDPWHYAWHVNITGGAQTFELIPFTPPGQTSTPLLGQMVTLTFYSITKEHQ